MREQGRKRAQLSHQGEKGALNVDLGAASDGVFGAGKAANGLVNAAADSYNGGGSDLNGGQRETLGGIDSVEQIRRYSGGIRAAWSRHQS